MLKEPPRKEHQRNIGEEQEPPAQNVSKPTCEDGGAEAPDQKEPGAIKAQAVRPVLPLELMRDEDKCSCKEPARKSLRHPEEKEWNKCGLSAHPSDVSAYNRQARLSIVPKLLECLL